MTRRQLLRSMSLCGSFLSALATSVCAVRLLALWRALRWEVDTEWEGTANAWRIDPFKLLWALLCLYFVSTSITSVIGFVGIAQRKTSLIRFFRDYSIADLSFVMVSTVALSYSVFSPSYVRTIFCEEMSRQPELMRGMGEMGLSLENCEDWSERAVVVLLGFMFVILAIRLHFVIALTTYHNLIRRERHPHSKAHHRLHHHGHSNSLHRIYLLPTPTSPSFPESISSMSSQSVFAETKPRSNNAVVYAPVPVGGLSEQDAREMHAMEAWIPTAAAERQHRHSRSHSSSSPSSRSHHQHQHHQHHHGSHRSTHSLRGLGEGKLVDVDV